MLNFFPEHQDVPDRLAAEEFVLAPLTTAHVNIDYDAVMSSRDMLRLWSGEQWPRDDFTLADNLIDLEYHQREHQERVAFTYTVLAPSQDFCLGCLYIRPLSELASANPGSLHDCPPNNAMARFWVRASSLPYELDRRLLTALRSWFDSAWPLPQVYFHTRVENKQQLALFEAAALPRQFSLEYPGRGGKHHFYPSRSADE